MLRLVDVVEKNSSYIKFRTEQISTEDTVAYVVYDTSTGVDYTQRPDYMAWRCVTTLTSTGSETVDFEINNTTLYPTYSQSLSDYTSLDNTLLSVMTLQEYEILQDVLIRFDLVRKRLPNPGISVESTDGIGQNGSVSFAGGFYKKMTVSEIMRMMEGAMIEINGTPPRTGYWPDFPTVDEDKQPNPFSRTTGIPHDMTELVRTGTLIRCLIAAGILEVDINFSVSDSGLQLTFDRDSKIKNWYDSLLNTYKEMKTLFKWNHANHRGYAIGSVPIATGWWATMFNNATQGGIIGLNTILGFNARGSRPL